MNQMNYTPIIVISDNHKYGTIEKKVELIEKEMGFNKLNRLIIAGDVFEHETKEDYVRNAIKLSKEIAEEQNIKDGYPIIADILAGKYKERSPKHIPENTKEYFRDAVKNLEKQKELFHPDFFEVIAIHGNLETSVDMYLEKLNEKNNPEINPVEYLRRNENIKLKEDLGNICLCLGLFYDLGVTAVPFTFNEDKYNDDFFFESAWKTEALELIQDTSSNSDPKHIIIFHEPLIEPKEFGSDKKKYNKKMLDLVKKNYEYNLAISGHTHIEKIIDNNISIDQESVLCLNPSTLEYQLYSINNEIRQNNR